MTNFLFAIEVWCKNAADDMKRPSGYIVSIFHLARHTSYASSCYILLSLSSSNGQSGGKQQLYTVVPWDKMCWMSPDMLCPLRPSNKQPSAVITLFAFQLLYCQQRKVHRARADPAIEQGCVHTAGTSGSKLTHKWYKCGFRSDKSQFDHIHIWGPISNDYRMLSSDFRPNN